MLQSRIQTDLGQSTASPTTSHSFSTPTSGETAMQWTHAHNDPGIGDIGDTLLIVTPSYFIEFRLLPGT